jgi:tetratricopeptide (TPR) repeat protein
MTIHRWRVVSCSLLIGLLIFGAAASAQPSLLSLRQATVRDPQNVSAWIALGNAYMDAGDFASAKQSFQEAIALDYRAGDAHFGLALAEFERGDYPAALFGFSEVSRLFPERFDAHFNRAVTLAKLRRYEESADAFRAALERAGDVSPSQQIEAQLGLAAQLTRSGDHAGAAAAYEAALELRPSDDEISFLWGEAQVAAGDGLEALPRLAELEGRSSDPKVSTLIADIYLQAQQPDYAVSALERALRKAQRSGDGSAQANILLELGLLQRSLGRHDAATSAFQRAAAADAANWQVRYNLGVSYLESGRPQDAVGHLENAAALNGESGEIRLALASAYDLTGRTPSAMSAADAALPGLSDPALIAQAHLIRGRALYRQGNYLEALQVFDGVIAQQPDNASAQLWAGLSAYALANYRAAVQYIERAVQLEPNSVEARVNLGAAYLAAERYQDAEIVYGMLVAAVPDNAEAHYNLGWSLYAQNRREAAREAWINASDLGFRPAQDALQQYF